MRSVSWSLLALAFMSALGGCAAETSEESPVTESPATEAATALADSAYELTDEEAVATMTRGDCELAAGDLVFHRSLSEQAGAIAYLTASELTHVGVVFRLRGAWSVYEAVGPVKLTPLDAWIARGQGRRFATARAAGGLGAAKVKALFEAGKEFFGKPYDLLFTEGDDKIYCSELALKMFERAGSSWLGALWSPYRHLWQRVDTLDGWDRFEAELASPADSSDEKLVKKIMAARGVEAREFARQTLVTPVALSDAARSGGAFEQRCALAAR